VAVSRSDLRIGWHRAMRAVARAQAKQEIAVLKIIDKLLNKGLQRVRFLSRRAGEPQRIHPRYRNDEACGAIIVPPRRVT
jgi:hypothetical protein